MLEKRAAHLFDDLGIGKSEANNKLLVANIVFLDLACLHGPQASKFVT
jgi:hypothetical protein